VVAYPVPAHSTLRTGENVKPGFEPIGEAVRYFDGFVELVIVRIEAIHGSLESLEGEVTVQLDHGLMRRNGLVGIDLDLIVVLREQRETEKE
jgi:hypothetical protein